MTNERKLVAVPIPKDMELPHSSGVTSTWYSERSATEIAEYDADFVETHARLIQARAAQHQAAVALVAARLELGKALGRLAVLKDVIRDEAILAQSMREHQQKMADLAHLTAQLDAEAAMLAAKHRRDQHLPAPAPEPSPTSGLSLDDIEENLAMMADVPPATRDAILRILKGAMQDRRNT